MYEYLVVRLCEGVVSATAAADWMLLKMNGGDADVHHGSLREAGDYYAALASKPLVVVLAPARDILMTTAQVPVGQQRYAKQALPFLVEEKLAEDIEDVHIAMGPVHKNQPVPVAVVRHFDVINWLDALYGVGLPTTWMVPEQLAVPWRSGSTAVFLDHSGGLVRDGQWQGLGCELPNLELAVKSVAEHGAAGQRKIELAYSEQSGLGETAQQLREGLLQELDAEISLLAYQETTTEVLARNVLGGLSDTINLLQGGYAVKTPGLRGTLNVRKIATTFAACVALHLAFTMTAGIWFDWRADTLTADAITQYRHWFPQAQRVFNPRRQLQSKLVSEDGAGSELLISYIGAVASDWQQGNDLRLQSMDYEGQAGSMTLQLSAPAADSMAALQKQLQSRGLHSELKSVSQRGDLVTGRLKLGGMH